MRTPIRFDLFGDRGLAFSDTLPIVGVDLTAAAFTAQARAVPDATGSPLITLAVALSYGGSDTVANHVAAGRIPATIYTVVNPATGKSYAVGDTIALSVVTLSADATAMASAGIPEGTPLGSDVLLSWDLLIDPAGALTKDKWVAGAFTVRGTVTQ